MSNNCYILSPNKYFPLRFFFKIYLFYVCEYFVCLFAGGLCMCLVPKEVKEVIRSLELDLRMVWTAVWGVGTRLEASAGASVLHPHPESPQSPVIFQSIKRGFPL